MVKHAPIKIGMVVGKMVGGGVESVVLDILKYADKKKYSIDFIVDEDSTLVPIDFINEYGGNVYYVPPYQHLLGYMKSLYKLLKKNNYTIVHSNISSLNVFPLFIAYVSGVPIRIAHNHNLIAPGAGRLKNILKYILSYSNTLFPNYMIAPTRNAGKWVFRNKSFTVISNGINACNFMYSEADRKRIRESLGIGNGDFVFGSFGRMVSSKRIGLILDVVKKIIVSGNSNIKLLLVGNGPQLPDLKMAVDKDIDLKRHVILLPNQSDISGYYSSIDAYVFPSSSEAFGMAAVEAQTNGLVVYVSNGVPDEARVSEKLFRRISDDSVNAWAEELTKAIENNYDRLSLSKSVVNSDRLSSKNMVRKIENVYDKAVQKYEKEN